MINIKTLTKDDIGREIIWELGSGEYIGRLVSWDDEWIYVRCCPPPACCSKKTNKETGIRTSPRELGFKYFKIITRADLMDLSDD